MTTVATPERIGYAYKVFYRPEGTDKLYPPMVANPNGETTPTGVWLKAEAGEIAGRTKTGRLHVKAGGKGTRSGKLTLSYRPGWHLGETPDAPQFLHKDGTWPKELVFAVCQYDCTVDYQAEADSYGYTKTGKWQNSLAGLPRVPENGRYRYRTNPNPKTPTWIITGAMKVLRVLDMEETNMLRRAHGLEDLKVR